ncbi:hypothetical protein KR222_009795, partial [Zaprionus bogoriensis]
ESVVFKFTNAVCESHNKTIHVIHKCRLQAINRHTTVFNYNATFLQPVNDVIANMAFYRKANGYKPWLYNVTVDVCKFFRKAYNPVFLSIFKHIRKFTNFQNQKCPLLGPEIVENFTAQTKDLKAPMPSGEYLFKFKFYFNKKPGTFVNLYFQFVEDWTDK